MHILKLQVIWISLHAVEPHPSTDTNEKQKGFNFPHHQPILFLLWLHSFTILKRWCTTIILFTILQELVSFISLLSYFLTSRFYSLFSFLHLYLSNCPYLPKQHLLSSYIFISNTQSTWWILCLCKSRAYMFNHLEHLPCATVGLITLHGVS